MDEKSKLALNLKKQVIQFMTELSSQFPNYQEFSLGLLALEYLPPEKLAEKCIEILLPFSNHILNKDETFFLQNELVQSDIMQSHIHHIKQLWLSNNLDEDDKDVIWTWFKYFIIISEKYSKLN